MLVTYFVLAVLASAYPAVLYATSGQRHCKRVRQCCQHTIGGFLETSLIFSVSMLVAALYRYASAIRRTSTKIENQSEYALIYSFTLSTLSVFPPIMLQALAEDDQNRKILRLFLWVLVAALVIPITVVFYLVVYADLGNITRKAPDSYRLWMADCAEYEIILGLEVVMFLSHVLLLLNLPWLAHETSLYITRGHSKFDHWVRNLWAKRYRTLEIIARVNVFLCGLMMWAILILVVCNVVIFSRRAGQWDKDQEWGFGQVLSIATFAPVLLEFVVAVLGTSRLTSVPSFSSDILWHKNRPTLKRALPLSQKVEE